MKKFKEYSGLNLSDINKEMLSQWSEKDIFHKSIETREGKPSFVFYEGPPSANGLPGIHHVMGRTIKDVFCRYKTMQGFQVKRKAGWDTHGLPVELGVEKALGITKEDIGKTISVDDYNAACRTSPTTTATSKHCGGCSNSFITKTYYTKATPFSLTRRLPAPDFQRTSSINPVATAM